MGSHSIDKVKDKQCDVKRNIETKKSELSQLEQRKQSLMDSGTGVQNSNMDDEVKKQVMELINRELEMNWTIVNKQDTKRRKEKRLK